MPRKRTPKGKFVLPPLVGGNRGTQAALINAGLRGVVVDFPAAEAVVGVSGCRWPIGDVKKVGFRFCCGERRPSRAYCDEHHAVAHQAEQPRRVKA